MLDGEEEYQALMYPDATQDTNYITNALRVPFDVATFHAQAQTRLVDVKIAWYSFALSKDNVMTEARGTYNP